MSRVNPIMKSQDIYVSMLTLFYTDVVGALVIEREVRKDLETIRNRVSAEGLSFLTKTLPSLGKAVDRALSTDSVLDVPHFKKLKGSQLPQFMRTLLQYLFALDGYPLQDAAPETQGNGVITPCRETPTAVKQADALRAIRQICFWFYKLEVPPTRTQINETLNAFIQTEAEMWDGNPRTSADRAVASIARRLCHRVLAYGDPYSGLPKHGPGAVATGESIASKHRFSRWYEVLMDRFPYDEWFCLNSRVFGDSHHRIQSLPTERTGTAKVVLVPKDSRSPRLISCEPLEYQWIQQSIMRVMTQTIEEHPFTRGHVNFRDQEVNRSLAIEGSRTGMYATLDMKEASDRVSVQHVQEFFPDRWCEALFASRTTQTRLPDGRIVHLNKMAPMGSAVCFPIEAMVFWSLSVAGLIHTCGLPESIALRSVYVYGDDIVVNREYHAVITTTLEAFGLKVNRSKSCTHGFFRESCGMDAYRGYPVTPIRAKALWNSRRSPGGLQSWVAHSNNLWAAGYWRVAEMIRQHIQDSVRFAIPQTREAIGAISFIRPELPVVIPRKMRRRFSLQHTFEIEAVTTRPSFEETKYEGWDLGLRVMLDSMRAGDDPSPRTGTSTGTYPIAHRNKFSRAWTPCRINR